MSREEAIEAMADAILLPLWNSDHNTRSAEELRDLAERALDALAPYVLMRSDLIGCGYRVENENGHAKGIGWVMWCGPDNEPPESVDGVKVDRVFTIREVPDAV